MALVGELTALMLSHLLMSSPSRNSYISSGYGFGSKPRVHALAADYGSQGTHQALSQRCRLTISTAVQMGREVSSLDWQPCSAGSQKSKQNAQDEAGCSPSRSC